jgi:hypothetical protein
MSHLLAQPAERSREAGLDRAPRQPERLGRLSLGHLEEVARPDDLAVLIAKSVQGHEQGSPGLAGEDRRLGRWSRVERGAVLGRPESETGPAAGRPAPVPGLVGHDSEEPRSEGRSGAEASQRCICLHERILGSVFRIGRRTRHDVRGPDGDIAVAADQFVVGIQLASACAFDQFVVFQWTALHGQPYPVHPPPLQGSPR